MEDAIKFVVDLSQIQKLHINTMMMKENERLMVKEAIRTSLSKCEDQDTNIASIIDDLVVK